MNETLEGEYEKLHITPYRARSQTMNTVGAVASSAGAYAYRRVYTYIMLYYTYAVDTYYVCISVNGTFVRTTKSTV